MRGSPLEYLCRVEKHMGKKGRKTVKLIYIEPELYKRMKGFARANGLKISEFLEIVIECLEKKDFKFFEKMKRGTYVETTKRFEEC